MGFEPRNQGIGTTRGAKRLDASRGENGAVPAARDLPARERRLSIAELARASGLPTATIRTWERRYGFPRAFRDGSGRRGYPPSVLDQLLAVLALRREGVSMEAAVARVTGRVPERGEHTPVAPPSIGEEAWGSSIFAHLRSRVPRLDVRVHSKAALLALSHALEDETAAAPGVRVVVGSFQRLWFYRRARERWRALASQVPLCLAIHCGPQAVGDEAPRELCLPADHPLAREWVLAAVGQNIAFALVARERLSSETSDRARQFEALIALDPDDVRFAFDAAAHAVAPLAPDLAEQLVDAARPAAPLGPALAASLIHRTLEWSAKEWQ